MKLIPKLTNGDSQADIINSNVLPCSIYENKESRNKKAYQENQNTSSMVKYGPVIK